MRVDHCTGRGSEWQCRRPGIGCQASGVRCQVSGIGHQVSGVGHQASGIRCRGSGIGCQASGVGCRVSGSGAFHGAWIARSCIETHRVPWPVSIPACVADRGTMHVACVHICSRVQTCAIRNLKCLLQDRGKEMGHGGPIRQRHGSTFRSRHFRTSGTGTPTPDT